MGCQMRLLSILFLFFGTASIAVGADRPNILLILVDDLGYGDLSSYGATDLKSPHIDQLVRRGKRFDNFYANCPVCSPTRASVLTGRYPELVGVPGVIRTFPHNNWGYLAPTAKLLPQLLKPAGYHSAIIGKWHLGLHKPNRPTERGFDFFHGWLGDMMDDYYEHRRHKINYMRRNLAVIDPPGHATDLFTKWACDYLTTRAGKKDPFFLYLAYNAPHTPIQPPESWVKRVMKRQPDMSRKRARLVALIEHMDDGIGQVIEKLNSTKLARNTVVIFTSDNGGQVSVGARNGTLRDGKQSMYEGGLKVPCCVVWPDHITPGSTAKNMGLTMDLLPTICDIAKVKVTHKIDGMTLLPSLLGKKQDTDKRTVFFHRREGGLRYGGLTIHAARSGNWKLLQNSPFKPLELYNLKNDPLEQRNLARTHRKQFRQLAAALRVQLQRGGAVPWQRPQRRDADRDK